MKNTIYKYIFYEFLRYFSLTLFAFTIIVWTIQSVNFLDLVTEDGHAFLTYFTYSVLTISKVFTKLIPFCFMLSLILTITKLEKDNESIAIWTAGLNKIYIVNLIFRISIMIMLLQLFLTSVINPTALNFSREIIRNSELLFVSSMMKERQFNDTAEGLTIFIEEKIRDGEYKNIFIRDEGKILYGQGIESSTIFAKYGYLGKDGKSLILYNGIIQKQDEIQENKKNINVIKFDKTKLNFSGITTKSISEPKIQETSTLKIFNCMTKQNIKSTHNCSESKKGLMDNKIEFNKRFGMPIYIPIISLICSFLLTGRKDKKFYYYNKYIYFFICFVLLTLSEILVRYSGLSWNHTIMYYFLPISILPLFYFSLIRKFKYENLN